MCYTLIAILQTYNIGYSICFYQNQIVVVLYLKEWSNINTFRKKSRLKIKNSTNKHSDKVIKFKFNISRSKLKTQNWFCRTKSFCGVLNFWRRHVWILLVFFFQRKCSSYSLYQGLYSKCFLDVIITYSSAKWQL